MKAREEQDWLFNRRRRRKQIGGSGSADGIT